jgi:hypothetical protein
MMQSLVRRAVAPTPADPLGYSMMFDQPEMVTPDILLHYHDELVIAAGLAAGLVLSPQERALIRGFDDRQLAKLILDNAMSAWSHEDLVSNQLGVQFFRLHGADVNAGLDAADKRQRFLARLTEFFRAIQIVDNAAQVRRLAAGLPGRERWHAPKMTEARARRRFPELFDFGSGGRRLRIAVYDHRDRADKGRTEVQRAVPSAPGLHVAPYGARSFALYTSELGHFQAVLLKWVIDNAVHTGSGGALVEQMP